MSEHMNIAGWTCDQSEGQTLLYRWDSEPAPGTLGHSLIVTKIGNQASLRYEATLVVHSPLLKRQLEAMGVPDAMRAILNTPHVWTDEYNLLRCGINQYRYHVLQTPMSVIQEMADANEARQTLLSVVNGPLQDLLAKWSHIEHVADSILRASEVVNESKEVSAFDPPYLNAALLFHATGARDLAMQCIEMDEAYSKKKFTKSKPMMDVHAMRCDAVRKILAI